MNEQEIHAQTKDSWQLFVDGGSRNNPGEAGAGIVISKNNILLLSGGFFLGIKTNNQAEYLALILGLFFLVKKFHVKEHVHIFADSQLMVQQIKGTYKVKNVGLKPLYNVAKMLLQDINYYTIDHILRSENNYADLMVNHGIDKKRALPEDFQQFLKEYISDFNNI